MLPLGGWRGAALCLGLAATAVANRHVARGASPAAHAGSGRIVPQLSPKSDSHFFGYDYPDDHSPRAPLEKDFDHPYPVVQESDIYDKDFVKDENSDNGEWKVQMDYDHLRSRMEKLKADEHKIYQKKKELEKALQAAREKKKQAEEKEKKSDEEHHKAEEEAEAAVNEAKAAKEHFKPGSVNGMGADDNTSTVVGVANATKEVEKELNSIDDCEKQLVEAQQKLKSLQEEMKKLEVQEEHARKTKEAAAAADAALSAKESKAEAKLKEAQARHEAAVKSFGKESQKLHDMESGIEKAEARLRKIRGEVDQDGGVYRSKAGRGAPGSALLLAPLALLAVRC